jgi:hypothetical protein
MNTKSLESLSGKKRFSLLLFLACLCYFSSTGKAVAQQFTEQGQAQGVSFDYAHMVYIQGKNPIPQNASTFLPGETPVSRHTITITNNDQTTKRIRLKTICYIRPTSSDPLQLVDSDKQDYELKPGEVRTLSWEWAGYTAPAMPNTPEKIVYRVHVMVGDPLGSTPIDILSTGNSQNGISDDTSLQRHH